MFLLKLEIKKMRDHDCLSNVKINFTLYCLYIFIENIYLYLIHSLLEVGFLSQCIWFYLNVYHKHKYLLIWSVKHLGLLTHSVTDVFPNLSLGIQIEHVCTSSILLHNIISFDNIAVNSKQNGIHYFFNKICLFLMLLIS